MGKQVILHRLHADLIVLGQQNQWATVHWRDFGFRRFSWFASRLFFIARFQDIQPQRGKPFGIGKHGYFGRLVGFNRCCAQQLLGKLELKFILPGNRDRKAATDANFALQRHFATMQLGQPVHQRQPQPRAFILAR